MNALHLLYTGIKRQALLHRFITGPVTFFDIDMFFVNQEEEAANAY